MKKLELSYTAGRNIKCCNHCKKQLGRFSKSETQNYHLIQQSHS